MIYDLAIIGSGPAGIAAGVYAARKKIKTVFITESFENKISLVHEIQNWIGTVSISGKELDKNLKKHLEAYADDSIFIKEKERVVDLKKNDGVFDIKTNKSEYKAKTIFVSTGSGRRKLEIKGAREFENKGISYCATCDAPLFEGANMAVIGGGNSAFETALQLSAYAKSVAILQRSEFRADPITIKKALEDKKIKGFTNVDLLEIKGDKFVSAIIYKDKITGKTTELPVTGIFVEIGLSPRVEFLKDTEIKLNEKGEIIVNPKTQETSEKGIWAAGDCTDGLYKQNNIAVGDAIKALENIFYYLKKK